MSSHGGCHSATLRKTWLLPTSVGWTKLPQWYGPTAIVSTSAAAVAPEIAMTCARLAGAPGPGVNPIFFRNSPLHDGAVLIEDGLILAARCPLPITDQITIPSHFGMRHRAAIGMSEQTDALVVVVSEETGWISVADAGEVRSNLTPNELRNILLMEKLW